VQDADEPPLGPRECVIDESIVAGEINLELGNDSVLAGTVTVWMPRSGPLACRPHHCSD